MGNNKGYENQVHCRSLLFSYPLEYVHSIMYKLLSSSRAWWLEIWEVAFFYYRYLRCSVLEAHKLSGLEHCKLVYKVLGSILNCTKLCPWIKRHISLKLMTVFNLTRLVPSKRVVTEYLCVNIAWYTSKASWIINMKIIHFTTEINTKQKYVMTTASFRLFSNQYKFVKLGLKKKKFDWRNPTDPT